MKTATISRPAFRAVSWSLGTALIFAHTAAQACPGCKQNMIPGADGRTPPLNGASVAFGLSIFFLIFVIVALLGGLGFMMYRSCRTIAAHQRAVIARMDSEEAALDGLPAQA